MRAGDLRQRIMIQQKIVMRNAMGGEDISWAEFTATWAKVDPVSGHEYATLRLAQSEVTHRITIRYRPGITTAMRILFRGVAYNIHEAIDMESMHRELQFLCAAVTVNA